MSTLALRRAIGEAREQTPSSKQSFIVSFLTKTSWQVEKQHFCIVALAKKDLRFIFDARTIAGG